MVLGGSPTRHRLLSNHTLSFYHEFSTLRKHAHAISRIFFICKKMKIFSRKSLIFSLFLLQNIDCGYTLEPRRRGGSNEYPQSMFWSKTRKIGSVRLKGVYFSLTCFPGDMQGYCRLNFHG